MGLTAADSINLRNAAAQWPSFPSGNQISPSPSFFSSLSSFSHFFLSFSVLLHFFFIPFPLLFRLKIFEGGPLPFLLIFKLFTKNVSYVFSNKSLNRFIGSLLLNFHYGHFYCILILRNLLHHFPNPNVSFLVEEN